MGSASRTQSLLAAVGESGGGGEKTGPLAGGRTAHATADLCGVEVELGEGAAEGVAMHAKLFGGLALIAFVVREDLEDIAALELPDRLGVVDSGVMHLGDEAVEFALQSCPHPCSFF